MPSIRTDKQIYPFFDSVKNPISAAGTSDSFHNVGYENMTFEVAGPSAISMKVEGCVNILKPNGNLRSDSECEWSELAIINLKSFDVLNSISSEGIYAVSISGMARVRLVVQSITGQATITGVAGA